MGTLNFTDKEQQLFVEILEGEIPDLWVEIWYTNDYDYRESLREGERLIKDLLGKLKESK